MEANNAVFLRMLIRGVEWGKYKSCSAQNCYFVVRFTLWYEG